MLRKAIHIALSVPILLAALLAANGVTVFVHRCHCHHGGLYVSLMGQQQCEVLHGYQHHCHAHCHGPCGSAHHHAAPSGCAHSHAHSVDGGPLFDIIAETECCGCEDERIALKLLYPLVEQTTIDGLGPRWLTELPVWMPSCMRTVRSLSSEADAPPPSPPPAWGPSRQLACARSALAPSPFDPYLL